MKRRELFSYFRFTLSVSFDLLASWLSEKIIQLISSCFATRSVAWYNYSFPWCPPPGPNNATPVDYRHTEILPLGPSTFIIFSAVCSIPSFSENEATETGLITPGSEDVLRGAELFSFFLMPQPTPM